MTRTNADMSVSGIMPLSNVFDILNSEGFDECAEMQDLSFGSHYECWGSDDHGELGFGAIPSGGEVYQLATPTTVLSPSAAKMIHGQNHACVVLSENAKVEVWCYGRADAVANGDTDKFTDQVLPAPIKWDPKSFESTLQ